MLILEATLITRGIKDWLGRKGRRSQESDDNSGNFPTPPPDGDPSELPEITGLVTDQKVLQWYYSVFENKSIESIATDQFLDKSKSEYCAPWLAREVVQNFVDHNKQHPGTLDGVNIQTKLEDSGETTFTIRGDWIFDDPTGLIAPHSDKPVDVETAGGNGIGLKQVAIRYLRDFGVKNFRVQGEGWAIKYRLAKKDEINATLQAAGSDYSIRHDWLIAELEENETKGSNSYQITTDSPELISSLSDLHTIGVSESNPHLKEPDFSNEHGTIKWIMPDAAETRGRLFINGQVFSYSNKGTEDDYWQGIECMSLQLNDIKYKMNIDRPPVSSYDLRSYASNLVGSMEKEELIEQLKLSHKIWTAEYTKSESRWSVPGVHTILELMTERLQKLGFSEVEYDEHFGKMNLLAKFYDITDEQEDHLREEGYSLCPEFFTNIGVPSAQTKLSTLDQAALNKPESPDYQMEKVAESSGMRVVTDEIKAKSAEELFSVEVKSNITELSVSDGFLDIQFSGVTPSQGELSHPLNSVKGKNQKMLKAVRSIIFKGLSENWIEEAITVAGKYVTTYGEDYDLVAREKTLLVRNTSYEEDCPLRLRIKASDEVLKSIMKSLSDSSDSVDELEEVTSGEVEQKGVETEEEVTSGEVEQKGAETEEEDDNSAAIEPKAKDIVETDPPATTSPLKDAAELGEVGSGEVEQKGAETEKEDDSSAATEPKVKNMAETDSPEKTSSPAGEDAVSKIKPTEQTPSPKDSDETEYGAEQEDASEKEKAAQVREALELLKDKKPDPVTEDGRAAKVGRELEAVDIQHPEASVEGSIRVVEGEHVESASDQRVKLMNEIEERFPELATRLSSFIDLLPKEDDAQDANDVDLSPVEKYLKWRRESGGQYEGMVGSISGVNVANIISEFSQSDVAVIAEEPIEEEAHLPNSLQTLLSHGIDKLSSPDTHVDHFEVVSNPTALQVKRLSLLKAYIQIATDVAVPNDLFVFDGTGSLGVNIAQKAIGLNSAILDTSFDEALRTFVHEIAHNHSMDHDYPFMHAMESLFTKLHQVQSDIIDKAVTGAQLTQKEKVLIKMKKEWAS